VSQFTPVARSVISVSPWCNGFQRFNHYGDTEIAEDKKNLKSGYRKELSKTRSKKIRSPSKTFTLFNYLCTP